MKLGVWGARWDEGGLAAMSREFVRHLEPDRTMVVDLGERSRGEVHPEWYPGAEIQHGMDHLVTDETIRNFCAGLDVVVGFETWYRDAFCDFARSVGCRTLLIAMPELWRSDLAPPDAVWVPTTWEADRIRGARVVPFPVARDRLPFVARTEASTFLHMAAPAFQDRNGARLVRAALAHVTEPCRLIVHGDRRRWTTRVGCVVIEQSQPVADYWQAPEADVLLLPRRYAGQCLPLQEAMSRGMAPLMLDLPPYNEVLAPESLVATRGPGRPVRMVGGAFRVHDAEPRAIAARMDELVRDPTLVERLSKHSDLWADAYSWDRWAPRYRELLAEVALAA